MAVGDIGAQAVDVDVLPVGDVLRVQPGGELRQITPIGGDGVGGAPLKGAQEVVEGGLACGRRRIVQGRGLRLTQGAMSRVATSRR